MAQVDSVGMIFTHMAQSCKPSWFGKGRGSIRHKGSIRQMSHRRVYEYSQPLLEVVPIYAIGVLSLRSVSESQREESDISGSMVRSTNSYIVPNTSMVCSGKSDLFVHCLRYR